MHEKSEQSEDLSETLAEGIAAVMAADESLEWGDESVEEAEGMADLFLEELNRLWAVPGQELDAAWAEPDPEPDSWGEPLSDEHTEMMA